MTRRRWRSATCLHGATIKTVCAAACLAGLVLFIAMQATFRGSASALINVIGLAKTRLSRLERLLNYSDAILNSVFYKDAAKNIKSKECQINSVHSKDVRFMDTTNNPPLYRSHNIDIGAPISLGEIQPESREIVFPEIRLSWRSQMNISRTEWVRHDYLTQRNVIMARYTFVPLNKTLPSRSTETAMSYATSQTHDYNSSAVHIPLNCSRMLYGHSSGVKVSSEEADASYSADHYKLCLRLAFQPIMSYEERQLTLFILQSFVQLCLTHNLTFFLYGGTLLGAYRHHNLIPWDDDVDVMMDAVQSQSISKHLGSLSQFELFILREEQAKFFLRNVASLPERKYSWPYVDIFFFKRNRSHVHDIKPAFSDSYIWPINHVFPLQLRPFAGVMLPVPCNMEAFIRKNYFPWLCTNNAYLHKFEREASQTQVRTRVACRKLFHLYPFVQRKALTELSTLETLIKGGKTLYRTVTSTCQRGTAAA